MSGEYPIPAGGASRAGCYASSGAGMEGALGGAGPPEGVGPLVEHQMAKSHTFGHEGSTDRERRHKIDLLVRHLQQHDGNNARTPSTSTSMSLRRAWTLPTTEGEADVARAWGAALHDVLATGKGTATSPLLDGAPQKLLEIYSKAQAEVHDLEGAGGPCEQQVMDEAVEDMARMCVSAANDEDGQGTYFSKCLLLTLLSHSDAI